MFEILEQPLRRALERADVYVTLVDVGARNGVFELGRLADRVDVYGFEPNPDEYEKLLGGRTDLQLAGHSMPRYRSVRWLPYALGESDGRAPFYVLRNAGASGLLRPDVERAGEWSWRGFDIDAGSYFEVDRVVELDVRTLATVAREELGLEHVDYLKVDVEGSEYEVLAGAEPLLSRVGVVRCEVSFVPRRIGQKLFSHVDLLLREHGFDLLRYEIDQEQIGYKERTGPAVFGPYIGYADRYGQPVVAEAIYVNRALEDPQRALAQAAVLIERNYLDEALFVLKRKTDVRDPELLELLRSYVHLRPAQRAFLAARSAARNARRLLRPRRRR